MNLFILNKSTFEIDISPEVVLLKPFNKIIKRDRSKLKNKAKGELAFIYFMSDYKSDFQNILDYTERQEQVISVIDNLSDEWKPDKVVIDAMDFYKKRSETVASIALEKQRENIQNLVNKVGKFINSDDANDVSKGANISAKINSFIEDLSKLEKLVQGQQESSNRHRGSQEKGMMEDEI